MFIIKDNFSQQVVASRKTMAAARKWTEGLNKGCPLYNNAPRYSVSLLEHKG